ncbi:uncharacterized protein LOC107046707 isoform X2 [Diachasma alloeum]|uniref:uncharacterized protein LOC107046707 isoform X2 n=2 Tax=Diachasma alloeum TaxID=454923 RepID=UPI0007382D38|nr:uncharacterized protein LOC107046707 isoform X2 [Diachasma alloeum]
MLAIQLFHRVSITKTKPKLEFDSQNDVSASVTVDVYDFLPSPPATETETVPHDDQVHDDSSSSEDNDVIRKSNYLKEKQRVERSTNRDEKSIQEVHSSPDKYEKIADHESEDRAPPIRKASDKPLREDDDFETLATALLAPRKPQNRPKNTQRKVTQTTKRSNRQSRISEEMRSRADLMQEAHPSKQYAASNSGSSEGDFNDCIDMIKNIRNDINEVRRNLSAFRKHVETKFLQDNLRQLRSTPLQDPRDGMKRFGMPPAVGFCRINEEGEETIHLGQGVWILKTKYDNAKKELRSEGHFVKNISVAIMGEDLQLMSVTGKKGPRALERKPAISPHILMAIRGFGN